MDCMVIIGGTLRPPSDVCGSSFPCPSHTLIKLCYTKALERSSLVPGPEAKSSSEVANPTLFTVSYQQQRGRGGQRLREA